MFQYCYTSDKYNSTVFGWPPITILLFKLIQKCYQIFFDKCIRETDEFQS